MRRFYGPPIPGSISPVPATDEMTEPVGIKDGQLWTKGPDAGLVDRVEELEDDVSDLQTDVGNLEPRVEDAEDDIESLDRQINNPGGIEDRLQTAETNIQQNTYDIGQARGDIVALGTIVNGKLDKPTNTGTVGDVIVKTADGTEYQAVAPFNPNGDYPNVSVGSATVADNINPVSENSGATQDEPFFFQATATENNTGAAPTAPQFKLKSLRGNTIVYNQLVDGVSSTYPTISGHVYWFKHDPLITLVTSTGTNINVPTPQDDLLVDLTRWFNGSIPQAILDDPTVFPTNYYDDDLTYSAGELKNCSCTELKTVGFNAFDGELESGSIDATTGAKVSSASFNRSKNYIEVLADTDYYWSPNTLMYAVFYDINHNVVDGGAFLNANASVFHTKKGAKYMLFAISNAYTGDININLSWDGERDGTYEPYTSHTYPMVWSGKSAGSAYDEKLPDGTEITRIVGYTFTGNENITVIPVNNGEIARANGKFTIADIDSILPGIKSYDLSGYTVANIISNRYLAVPNAVAGKFILNQTDDAGENVFSTYSKRFYIQSSAFQNKTNAEVKALLAGLTIYIDVETPTTSSGDAYTSVIEGDDYGTMEFDSVVPVGNEFFYPADYALLIDDLGNYVNYDVNDIVKYSDFPIPAPPTSPDGTYKLIATVSGGTATLSWTADS